MYGPNCHVPLAGGRATGIQIYGLEGQKSVNIYQLPKSLKRNLSKNQNEMYPGWNKRLTILIDGIGVSIDTDPDTRIFWKENVRNEHFY